MYIEFKFHEKSPGDVRTCFGQMWHVVIVDLTLCIVIKKECGLTGQCPLQGDMNHMIEVEGGCCAVELAANVVAILLINQICGAFSYEIGTGPLVQQPRCRDN